MAPIRVGLIGLPPALSEHYKPGEWGQQHLNAIKNSPHFELVAVCNSSVASAEKSIKSNGLPSTVKAYGSPEDIARDPNVDLISVVVRIYRHYELTKPAIEQGKDVLVEFPFSTKLEHTEELMALAKSKGVRNVVAAQARANPAIRKLKEIIDKKTIGDIVYTSFSGVNGWGTPPQWPDSTKGFLKVDDPISRVNIILGHAFDAFISVVGGFVTIQSVFKNQVKSTQTVDSQGAVVDPDFNVTAPEQMLLQGILKSGAAANFSIRTTATAAEKAAYRWVITGTEGEVVYTADAGTFQTPPPNQKIYLKKGDAEIEQVDFSREEGEYIDQTAMLGVNVQRLYDAYAKGEDDALSTIEQTLETEKQILGLKNTAIWAP
ncbi:NAD(P)-binding protein [Xylariaceae sp. FL1272]|nr:NAD(P)-binding protein [Xylariaceae sp. FL1272]